jgi:hypothetical protein
MPRASRVVKPVAPGGLAGGRRRLSLLAVAAVALGPAAPAEVLHVPADYATIQAAIDAASTGDTVLVAHGTYAGGLVIAGKTITLASLYIVTGDPADVTQTIVTGGDPMLRIAVSATDTTVMGLSFQSGGYGLVNYAPRASILNNRFIDTGDAVSFETSGGVVRGNLFDGASDDGVDADHASSDLTIENNVIVDSNDDGIEIRLHDYTGPMITIVIRNNTIAGNDEDGIQLIDYAGLSNRRFRIERNLIVDNAQAGLGCTANGNSAEDLAGSAMLEEVQLLNNTFSGNPVAITGGDNMLVLNNVIANSTQTGLKRASASSLASFNDFWNNATDHSGSNVDVASSLFEDPLLGPGFQLQPGSPCIDAGAATLSWNGSEVAAPSHSGPAPDLGARESPVPAPDNVLTVGNGGAFADIQSALDSAAAPFTIVSVAPGNYPAFTIGAAAPYGLRVAGDGTGMVTIDTRLQPVLVYGLPVSGAVELADLTIGSPGSSSVGLAVASCAGLVLLDELVVHGGVGQAGILVAASTRTAIQRSDLDGTPGLKLIGASNAIASGGTLDELVLAGSSVLTSCQLVTSGTIAPGSTHTALGGVMPSVTMPRLVHVGAPFTITLEGTPSQLLLCCVSIQLGYLQPAKPKLEMALIASVPAGLLIPLGPLPLGGSLVLSSSLPPSGALLGAPLVIQVITADTSTGTFRFGHAATVVPVP